MDFYGVKLYLFYGKDLFAFFKRPEIWVNILSWLKNWKNDLPEMPEINFDTAPSENFAEIKDLELRTWRKILDNEKLWEEGIIKTIFRTGTVLQLLLRFFKNQQITPYNQLAEALEKKLSRFFK
jgi:hypothetical protein